jgi:hypothetical protein
VLRRPGRDFAGALDIFNDAPQHRGFAEFAAECRESRPLSPAPQRQLLSVKRHFGINQFRRDRLGKLRVHQ